LELNAEKGDRAGTVLCFVPANEGDTRRTRTENARKRKGVRKKEIRIRKTGKAHTQCPPQLWLPRLTKFVTVGEGWSDWRPIQQLGKRTLSDETTGHGQKGGKLQNSNHRVWTYLRAVEIKAKTLVAVVGRLKSPVNNKILRKEGRQFSGANYLISHKSSKGGDKGGCPRVTSSKKEGGTRARPRLDGIKKNIYEQFRGGGLTTGKTRIKTQTTGGSKGLKKKKKKLMARKRGFPGKEFLPCNTLLGTGSRGDRK